MPPRRNAADVLHLRGRGNTPRASKLRSRRNKQGSTRPVLVLILARLDASLASKESKEARMAPSGAHPTTFDRA
jgi:hypothetical protein